MRLPFSSGVARAARIPGCVLAASQCSLAEVQALTQQVQALRQRLAE